MVIATRTGRRMVSVAPSPSSSVTPIPRTRWTTSPGVKSGHNPMMLGFHIRLN